MLGLYDPKKHPVIAALVEFAAQNSGLDWRNYYSNWQDRSGVRAYRQEVRDIGNDWKRFKEALAIASMEGVKDEHVIAEAPHAYSGRLTWADDHWAYCTGQYFCTEYRKAAATLLEYATRAVRKSRPAEKRAVASIGELKALNEKNGGCWFEPATMRFFKTRIESGILKGKYFITSEQNPSDARRFTIRTFDDEGGIDTVGEFHAHHTYREALEALNAHLVGYTEQTANL